MTIKVVLTCGGCFAETSVDVREEVEQISENWVRKRVPRIPEVTPEGWVAFDPYTGCCYCPECWAGIVGPRVEKDDADPPPMEQSS